MSLGARLKLEREKKGWSQIDVAEKIGITNAVLSNYERDYRDPDTQNLTKLADLYQVSTDYLLGRIQVPTPNQNDSFGAGWTDEEKEIATATVEAYRKKKKEIEQKGKVKRTT
ncbi:hypothetical protein Elgi_51570 [Paenibacillus elgii]|uniref:helix-turn-helix domain-containing protein n=1 Tax=Paenibacillus elgii TaxID=189691 RepID=UPI002D7C182E|nr:hypothetical protein Elgi_51570 [Paenibacillus elgii]